MKVRWLEKQINTETIQQLIPGKKVKSVKAGNIGTGYRKTKDITGLTDIDEPITFKGVEVEFETDPTEEELEEIDKVLPYTRQGQESKLGKLEKRIKKLEDKSNG